MYFFFGSPELDKRLTAISKATAANAHLFPPHRKGEMKDLLLHNQIPTIMISWVKQILNIKQFSQPSHKGKPYTNLSTAFPGWETQE